MSHCRINLITGDCSGDCPQNQTCKKYKVVPDVDLHPEQVSYSDDQKNQWKCDCKYPPTQVEMEVDTITLQDLKQLANRIQGVKNLDYLFQKRLTQDMVDEFERLSAHSNDCVFGVLQFLKLATPEQSMTLASQNLQGCGGDLWCTILLILNNNPSNNWYKLHCFYLFLPDRFRQIFSKMDGENAVLIGIKRSTGSSHALIFAKISDKPVLIDPQVVMPGFSRRVVPQFIEGWNAIDNLLRDQHVDAVCVLIHYGLDAHFGTPSTTFTPFRRKKGWPLNRSSCNVKSFVP